MNHALNLAAAALCCSAALPASSQVLGNIVDAAHFQIDYAAPLVWGIGGTSHQRLAQTLTVEVGGTLAGVFVPVACGSGRLNVEIRDVAAGKPGPTVLDHRTVDAADLADTLGRFSYVRIPGALPLAAGQEIAIVLENKRGVCFARPSPVSSNYAGGQGFFEALPNPPGWVAFSDFVNTPDDLPFQLVLE